MDSAILKYTARLLKQNLDLAKIDPKYAKAIVRWNHEKLLLIVRLQEIQRKRR